MRKGFTGFLSFAIAVIIILAVLKIINWLPMAVEKDSMRKYRSVDEVRLKLNIKDLYVPSYFPQNLKWPPSDILAQSKPFIAVLMEFRDSGNGDIYLTISQAAINQTFLPDRRIKMVQIKERVSYSLNGRNALLEVGTCRNDQTCSQISWDEGKYRIEVVMKSAPFELIKIAESMLR